MRLKLLLSFGVASMSVAMTTPSAWTSARNAPTPRGRTPHSRPPGEIRRVWVDDGDIASGSPSPDGRLFAITDWVRCPGGDYGNIVLWDLAAGTSRGATDYKQCNSGAQNPRFSPDGKRIAYEWYGSGNGEELRVGALDSPVPHTLIPPMKEQQLFPEDWTPDGAAILFVIVHGKEPPQLAEVPANGGAVRILKTFTEWHAPFSIRMRASPDGRLIAYSFPSSQNDGRQDVGLLSTESGRDISLFKDVAMDYVVGWTPDGGRLLIASDRGKSRGIWALPFREDKPAGNLELVRGDMWRTEGIRTTARGDVFYKVESGDRDVYMASLEPGTRHLVSVPARLPGTSERFAGYARAWSADGKFFAFDASASPVGGAGSHFITVASVDGGAPREFRLKVNYVSGATWYPDGAALALAVEDDKGRGAVQRLDLRTGDLTKIVEARPGVNKFPTPALSRDGRTMYFISTDSDQPRVDNRSHIVARDLTTGREHVLYTPPDGRIIAGSLARANLCVMTRDKQSLIVMLADQYGGFGKATRSWLVLVSLADGSSRSLLDIRLDTLKEQMGLPPFLSPDGKAVDVLSARMINEATPHEGSYWRVPLDGRPPQKITLTTDGSEAPMHAWLSPDGRHATFLRGKHEEELWILHDDALQADTRHAGSARR